MRGDERERAGALVDFAALEADEAVFNHVYSAEAGLARGLVHVVDEFDGAHFFAVDRDGDAGLEGYFERDFLVGRVDGVDGELIGVLRRLVPRIFEDSALDGAAPEVVVDAVGALSGRGYGNVVRRGVVHLFFTREAPVADGREDFDVGVERVAGDFDTDLVLSLAGAAVGDGDGAFLLGAPDERLGYHRARERRVERIYALVCRVGLERGPYEGVDEGFAQVDDVGLRGSGDVGLFLYLFKVVGLLSDVHGERDYFVSLLVEPRNRHRCVESSAVGQYYLSFFLCCHLNFLLRNFLCFF